MFPKPHLPVRRNEKVMLFNTVFIMITGIFFLLNNQRGKIKNRQA